ncbi:MAG: MFS transporter [Methanobacteriaceae archaeon]|nr:MFS transporter [Methanobacteriaceae archaeon]
MDNKSWIPLIAVSLTAFIMALDSTFMNVAVPQLICDLGTDVHTIQIIISCYTLITASLMLIGGKLQDIYGKKRIFLIGAIVFGIGAFLATISFNSIVLFIGWSVLEGIGGALMAPATISIIGGIYEGEMRTTALATLSAICGIAASLGPFLGGFFTSFLSWRYGFGLEVIIIIVVLALYNKIPSFDVISSKEEFDYVGSVLSVMGMFLLILGILNLSDDLLFGVGLIIISFIVLFLFGFVEKRVKVPLFDVRLLRDRNLSIGTGIRLLTSVISAGFPFVFSIYAQRVLGLSAFITGASLLPLTIGTLISVSLAPKFVKRFNHSSVICISYIIGIIGCVILAYQFTLNLQIIEIVPGMFILGLGLGTAMALAIDVGISSVPQESQSVSSGFISTGQNLGMSLGTAIMGIILIVGAVGGIHDAIDIYAPDKLNNQDFHDNVKIYIEKLGSSDISELPDDNSMESNIANTVIQDTMALIMWFTAFILFIGCILALSIQNDKFKKDN